MAEIASGKKQDVSPVIAVVDIGSSAVRMDIGQVLANGSVKILSSLQQEVSLGRDVFVTGSIALSSIEDCVRALTGFFKVINEYRIDLSCCVRIVATSAVREASNRDAFLDRIYIATGLMAEIADEADVHRYIYISVLPLLKNHEQISKGDIAVVEVGGGNTELLLFSAGQMVYSNSYRLGSFRMRETIETHDSGEIHLLEVMENQIQRTVADVKHRVASRKKQGMLVIGGDMRFAAVRLYPEWNKKELLSISVDQLAEFSKSILSLSVDELVRKYHITYPEAETLGPALLTYVRLAGGLGLKEIIMAPVSMRDGVISEVSGNMWADTINEQIAKSAIELGRKYDFDQAHSEHVAYLCKILFRGLKDIHKLDDRYEQMLVTAAILHDIGMFVANQSHHKHSMYLIRNSNLFGLGAPVIRLISVIVRYHRRSMPKSSHEEYRTLDRNEQMIIARLAAILRVADALDRGHAQRIKDVDVSVSDEFVIIKAANVADMTIEQLALNQKGDMFLNIYGKTAILKAARGVQRA